MLDEVAWLFNLRGSDIDYNPGTCYLRYSPFWQSGTHIHVRSSAVFFAYSVITKDTAVLFIESKQLDEDARKYLGDAVEIRPYEDIFDYLKGLPETLGLDGSKDGVSCSSCTFLPSTSFAHVATLPLFFC